MNRQAEFIEELMLLPDWRERYQLICELAAQMPPMPDALKVPANRVQGCQSVLYFHVATHPVVKISAWGNSAVSFGLAALLARLFNDLTPEQLRQVSIDFHIKSGLLDNLTMLRRQGLLEMISCLKKKL